MRPDRSEAFSAYWESLPLQRRGPVLLVLWVNAIVTLALQGAQLAVFVRIVRSVAQSDHPIRTALDRAMSPSTAIVVSASGLHELARERFVGRLDQRVRTA